jgi:hypothetical protein
LNQHCCDQWTQSDLDGMLRLGRILLIAATWRLSYITILLLLDRALPDYDTSAHLLSADCGTEWPQHVAAARRAPAALVVWDSVFFHRVAACGYEYEQFYAFFPGFPGEQAAAVASSCHVSNGSARPDKGVERRGALRKRAGSQAPHVPAYISLQW